MMPPDFRVLTKGLFVVGVVIGFAVAAVLVPLVVWSLSHISLHVR
jgi:hypothetical protein